VPLEPTSSTSVEPVLPKCPKCQGPMRIVERLQAEAIHITERVSVPIVVDTS